MLALLKLLCYQLLAILLLLTWLVPVPAYAQNNSSQRQTRKMIKQRQDQSGQRRDKFGQRLSSEERSRRADKAEKEEKRRITPSLQGDEEEFFEEELEEEELKEKPEKPEKPGKPEKLEPFGYATFDRAPSAFVPQMGVPVGKDYALGPGDDIIVYLWGNKLLMSLWEKAEGQNAADRVSKEIEVSPEGTIFLPQLGIITVVGMTIEQLEKNLEKRLQDLYSGIKVEVTLNRMRLIEIYVVGDMVRPGSYYVYSTSTVFNGLYVAGGPSVKGSMRKIKLFRRDKEEKTIDLYMYLLHGDKNQDYRLEAGDTIHVPPIGKTAAISGEVVRPARYELLGHENLKDLIKMAGGILPTAYLPRIQVDRIDNNQTRTVMDIDAAEVLNGRKEDIKIQDGDMVLILSVLEIYKNRVSIEGNVQRPGSYELQDNMRVSDLIRLAEGLLPNTDLVHVEIYRIRSDSTTEFIPFNLSKLLAGDKSQDILLQNKDRVVIHTPEDVKQPPSLGIRGEVETPGKYDLTYGMRISDLVFKAGSVKAQTAYFDRADLFRVTEDGNIVALAFNLAAALKGDPQENLMLKGYDEVVIYSRTDLNKIPFAQVEGEVANPGRYQLASNMKLKDLIFRAGGPTGDAYRARGELFRVLEDGSTQLIPFDLAALMNGDGSDGSDGEADNIPLQHYDRLVIYNKSEIKQEAQATVVGEVGAPGTYPIATNSHLSDLIFRAGGLTKDAYPHRVEVMRTNSNGTVEIISVNAGAILNGENGDGKLLDGDENLILKNHDRVIVYSNEEAKPQAITQIYGEVPREGKYRLRENMHLSDLIFRAGGLKNTAYMGAAEVARIEPDGTVKKVNVDLQAALKGDPQHDLILKENDGVFIRKKPDSEPRTVSVSGEVKFPGSYAVSKDETFSQLLERAGGLTKKAFPEGMLFFRRKENVEQLQILAIRPEVEAEKLRELRELRGMNKGKKAQTEGEGEKQRGIESQGIPTMLPSKSLSQKSETLQFQTSEPSQRPRGKEKEPPLGKIIVEPEEFEKPSLEKSKTRKGKAEPQLEPQRETDGKIDQDLEGHFGQRLDEIEDKLEGKLDDKIDKKIDRKFEERFLEMQKGQMELMEPRDMQAEERTETEKLSEKLPDVKEATDGMVRITIDFKSLTDQKDSSRFPLKDGDRFFIPERPIMVLVQGEISSPGGVMYKSGEGIKYYVEVAGGYTSEADKDKVYILRSNGRAVTSWLRYRNLGPGDTVIVPKKSARREFDLKGTIRDTAALLSGVLTVVVLARQLQK